MANAYHDGNSRPTLIAVDETDPTIIRKITADPTDHSLSVSNASTGSDNGNNNGIAKLDENSVAVVTALSSAGDGTIIEVYCDSNGKLLVDSN